MYVAAFVVGYFLFKKLADEKGFKITEKQYDNAWGYAIIGVILGGRLGHILLYEPAYYFSNPIKIVAIWEGGMAYHGGLIGVALMLLLFCKHNGFSFWQFVDLATIPAAIGQGLGRWGNFVNAELYGKITTLPWAIRFPTQFDPILLGEPRHPTQIYEMLQLFTVFLVLYILRKKLWTIPGLLSGAYLIGNGVMRFWVEFYRDNDPTQMAGSYFSQAQIYAGLSIVVGIGIIIYFLKKSKLELISKKKKK
jgi:phosphatidylglycerol:prolipoprotein diacylglycerol transferase